VRFIAVKRRRLVMVARFAIVMLRPLRMRDTVRLARGLHQPERQAQHDRQHRGCTPAPGSRISVSDHGHVSIAENARPNSDNPAA